MFPFLLPSKTYSLKSVTHREAINSCNSQRLGEVLFEGF